VSEVVLLTGATGFLGSRITQRLLEREGMTVLALVRAQDDASAVRRLTRAWWDFPALASSVGGRVEVLRGDVSEPRLGLAEAAYASVVKRATHIIHTAADMRLDGPIDELRRANVQGTSNVLELARAVHADHCLVRLSHVSTAYVAGGRVGPVPEDSLTDEWGFSSRYELSKYEGELLVRAAKAELPISVLRPGLVVGDSRTGAIKTFNTLYFPLRLYLTGQLRVLPARGSLRVNMVPVDYVADAVARLTFEPKAEGLNFHLTAPYGSLPTARELLDAVREWAAAHMGFRPPRAVFVPMPVPASRGRYRTQKALARGDKGIFDALVTLAPYFNERREFQRDNIDRLMGPYELDWRKVLDPILSYATYMSFLHRSDRTVHEQILFRLGGRSRPVTYNDVYDGIDHPRTAAEVKRDVLAAAGALGAMGIRPGDRVAMLGLNSSRYLTMDVAIGLTGAFSVPLYYTSPPTEIDGILKASGARMLFVGAPKVLERLGEMRADVTVVSFCRGALPRGLARPVVAWEDFLAKGAGADVPQTAPVGLGDIATLRYTSGTTGTPKGVAFRHDGLRWMGESLVSILPWTQRNERIAYVSFLPMNHVVEGILAAYAPYYAPSPLDIHFLEDFKDLPALLPRVRPTIFFAVPRVYEKVWEAMAKGRMGGSYMATGEGPRKKLLRSLIRRGLMKRAGWDRCAQLIVGSAPTSVDLLRQYSDLGIEVYDAYGLTEAPLVTMNRLGRNRPGTVGEPMPETQVRVASDGEILVHGPQVAAGYFDNGKVRPFDATGWLSTGDLGRLTPEGSIVVHGRKKELIVTSYGKNVHPVKVEGMLRDIPGVVDAMLVGDGRPFCGALVWVAEDHQDPASVETIARAIGEVNGRLSHPEQVKRWAILPYDLSVEGGALTASLKLKRHVVMELQGALIGSLYGSSGAPEGVLQLGGAGRE
jgi:long-chain acyl-CoA synthetase